MTRLTEVQADAIFERQRNESVKIGTLVKNLSSEETWKVIDFLIYRLKDKFQTHIVMERISDNLKAEITVSALFYEKDLVILAPE